MHIVIDVDLDDNGQVIATHYVDTLQLVNPAFGNPVAAGGLITLAAHLQSLSSNPALHAQCGWSQISKVTTHGQNLTRWQVLLAEIALPSADPNMKALNLV